MRPSVSVSSTSVSAPTRWATSAAIRSLSPNRISSSAVASFSLTTGTAPSDSSRSNVLRACRYWARTMKSSGAMSTCPATRSWAANASFQRCISRACPTADTACSVCASLGRSAAAIPSAGSPAATAPEDTTTTSWPAVRAAATSAAALAMASRRSSPCSSVRLDEPSLTTVFTARPRSRRPSRPRRARRPGRPGPSRRARCRRPSRRPARPRRTRGRRAGRGARRG